MRAVGHTTTLTNTGSLTPNKSQFKHKFEKKCLVGRVVMANVLSTSVYFARVGSNPALDIA
jgi:hypothetical protein